MHRADKSKSIIKFMIHISNGVKVHIKNKSIRASFISLTRRILRPVRTEPYFTKIYVLAEIIRRFIIS